MRTYRDRSPMLKEGSTMRSYRDRSPMLKEGRKLYAYLQRPEPYAKGRKLSEETNMNNPFYYVCMYFLIILHGSHYFRGRE